MCKSNTSARVPLSSRVANGARAVIVARPAEPSDWNTRKLYKRRLTNSVWLNEAGTMDVADPLHSSKSQERLSELMLCATLFAFSRVVDRHYDMRNL